MWHFAAISFNYTRKGPAQARVSTDIFHDGLRRETCSDTRITLAQYPIILAVHSVHFAKDFCNAPLAPPTYGIALGEGKWG